MAKCRETVLKNLIFFSGISVLVIFALFALTLVWKSLPSIKSFGFSFLWGNSWDPVSESFGAMPFLVGTLLTSFLALIIAIPFSMSLAIVLGDYFKEGFISRFLRSLVELLAGIPSVIYGFWGLLVLVPIVRKLQIMLDITPYGVGIFTASLILAIMIIPFSASMAREMINLVPNEYREAGIALGATRFEVITKIILPYARSGIVAGFVLALGRALGETMAVTMVIGNANHFPSSIFSLGNTMSSLVANEFSEASDDLYLSALIEIGLILFIVTIIINIIGKYLTKKLSMRHF